MGALLSRRDRKKAESRIALLPQVRVFERSIPRRELRLAAVFRDNHCVKRKNLAATSTPQKVQGPFVLRCGLVRWIEVHQVDRLRQFAQPLQHSPHPTIFQRKAPPNLQRRQIFPDSCDSGRSVFSEPDMPGTPAQRLDPDRPRPGIQIDEAAAINPWRKDIEQRLP